MKGIFALSLSLALATLAGHAAAGERIDILATPYPPYEFEPDEMGRRGFDVEVTEAVFHGINIVPVYKFMPWERAKRLVFEGKATALLSCARNNDRDQYILYSDQISQGTDGYFLRRGYDAPFFASEQDMRGQRIATVRGFTLDERLERLGIKRNPTNSTEQGLRLLLDNRVDIFLSSIEGARFAARTLNLSEQITHYVLRVRPYHVCFSRKWPGAEQLMDQFNRGLARMRNDGRFKKIHDQYR